MSQKVVFQYMKTQGAEPKKELLKSSFSSINSNFSEYFYCDLFDFYLELFEIKSVNNLPEIFWYESSTIDYDVVLTKNGKLHSINGKQGDFEAESLIGTLAYTIKKKAKKQTAKALYKDILKLSPNVNYFAVPLVVFGILMPFYSNLFNSRLIYNDSSVTFLLITTIFVLVNMVEIFIKKVIKRRSLNDIEASYRQLSDYFLLLLRDSRAKNISVKVRAIEQAAIYSWENLAQLMVDIAFVVLYVSCLLVMLNQYFAGLATYYLIIGGLMYYVRFRAYRALIQSFTQANDKSTFTYSMESKKSEMNFSNFNDLSGVFSDKYLADEVNRKSLDWQNHNWSELTRFNGFMSMAVMFFCCFLAIQGQAMEMSLVIAVMIINSRLSSSLTGLINKAYQLKVKKYHFMEAGEALFKDLKSSDGVTLDEISKIKVKLLNQAVLSKTFSGPVDFRFEAGKTYGLIGPSGSGKTTLLNIISGLNSDYEGEVKFNNLSLSELSQDTFSRLVSYHTANSQFVQTSLVDNFKFYGIHDIRDIVTIIKFCAPSFEISQETLTMIEANYLPLSNGERQKMLLLMSIYKKPALIVLDESTSFMSHFDASNMLKRIRQANPAAIILLASHDEKLVSQTDHVIDFAPKAKTNKVVVNV